MFISYYVHLKLSFLGKLNVKACFANGLLSTGNKKHVWLPLVGSVYIPIYMWGCKKLVKLHKRIYWIKYLTFNKYGTMFADNFAKKIKMKYSTTTVQHNRIYWIKYLIFNVP